MSQLKHDKPSSCYPNGPRLMSMTLWSCLALPLTIPQSDLLLWTDCERLTMMSCKCTCFSLCRH